MIKCYNMDGFMARIVWKDDNGWQTAEMLLTLKERNYLAMCINKKINSRS